MPPKQPASPKKAAAKAAAPKASKAPKEKKVRSAKATERKKRFIEKFKATRKAKKGVKRFTRSGVRKHLPHHIRVGAMQRKQRLEKDLANRRMLKVDLKKLENVKLGKKLKRPINRSHTVLVRCPPASIFLHLLRKLFPKLVKVHHPNVLSNKSWAEFKSSPHALNACKACKSSEACKALGIRLKRGRKGPNHKCVYLQANIRKLLQRLIVAYVRHARGAFEFGRSTFRIILKSKCQANRYLQKKVIKIPGYTFQVTKF